MSATLEIRIAPDMQDSPCTSCGACCAHSSEWPRFSLESDEALASIPEHLVAADGSGMRCEENRCCALSGRIGVQTACTIYAVRPDVCHACQPGDPECLEARHAAGLGPLVARTADLHGGDLHADMAGR